MADLRKDLGHRLRGAILQLFDRGTDAYIAGDFDERYRLDSLARELRLALSGVVTHGYLRLCDDVQAALDELEKPRETTPKARRETKPKKARASKPAPAPVVETWLFEGSRRISTAVPQLPAASPPTAPPEPPEPLEVVMERAKRALDAAPTLGRLLLPKGSP